MDNESFLRLLGSSPPVSVTQNHLQCALESLYVTNREIRTLIFNHRLPEEGLPPSSVSLFLAQLAALDSNNFCFHVGCGEREGRIFSPFVAERNLHMSHGIGRSGDLSSHQPKAAGSSLLHQLACIATLDSIRAAGITEKRVFQEAAVFPVATGMCLSLVLRALANDRNVENAHDGSRDPHKSVVMNTRNFTCFLQPPPRVAARYVVWCRIDQRTCIKCITAAGLIPIVVNPRRVAKENGKFESSSRYHVQSHVDDVRAAIEAIPEGPRAIVAVVTTTSCFSPRILDPILPIARLCLEKGIPHVINNAYGLQSGVACRALNAVAQQSVTGGRAMPSARIDAVVMSTDKNFMVPVGGSVLTGPSSVVHSVSRLYPGRASVSASLDLLATLLAMGRRRFINLSRTDRETQLEYFALKLEEFAVARREELVRHPLNDISLGITLRHANHVSTLIAQEGDSGGESASNAALEIGARLFHLSVTGPKVVVPAPRSTAMDGSTAKTVGGVYFPSYGMHGADEIDDDIEVPPMLITAAAIGIEKKDIDRFIEQLDKLYPKP